MEPVATIEDAATGTESRVDHNVASGFLDGKGESAAAMNKALAGNKRRKVLQTTASIESMESTSAVTAASAPTAAAVVSIDDLLNDEIVPRIQRRRDRAETETKMALDNVTTTIDLDNTDMFLNSITMSKQESEQPSDEVTIKTEPSGELYSKLDTVSNHQEVMNNDVKVKQEANTDVVDIDSTAITNIGSVHIKTEPETSSELLVGKGVGYTIKYLRELGKFKNLDGNKGTQSRDMKELTRPYEQRRAELIERIRASMDSDKSPQQSGRQRLYYQPDGAASAAEIRQLARSEADRLAGFQANVDIVYVDEFGQQLDERGEWKRLSHTFHGRGSGNKKTQQKLRKILGNTSGDGSSGQAADPLARLLQKPKAAPGAQSDGQAQQPKRGTIGGGIQVGKAHARSLAKFLKANKATLK
ncbi:hypothetical protein GQ42DRAFT_177984 [Ramicandelaber brevisporus]|nr:hypothetical protein GQ42DRAFT_177984 [Ramicandelaber brevisporus]